MDQELTGNAFKRFMRRRGLSRDRCDDLLDAAATDAYGEHLSPTPPPSSSTAPTMNDASSPPPLPLPHRSSSTFIRPRDARPTADAQPPHADNVRRTQSTFETTVPTPHSPRRRRRDNDEEPSKKQYRCEYCNLQFGRKHHKERHVANIHRHEKPYVCNMCGHPFHQKPNLDRHRATVHSEVSPFRCDECGLTFSRRGVLRNHVQSVHDRSRRPECPVCRVSLPPGRDLTEHMRAEHPVQFARSAANVRRSTPR